LAFDTTDGNDWQVAIYGLGNIRDERLHRTFRAKKVRLVKPEATEEEEEEQQQDGEGKEGEGKAKDFFSILVIHQNRIAHSPTNSITEAMIDELGDIDLVFWGHEHECRIAAEATANNTFITQPGSSVATSLSESEKAKKYVTSHHPSFTTQTIDTLRDFSKIF